MRVWLVTGGSGFIGRHVLDALNSRKDEVVAIGRTCPERWDARRFVVADLEVPETVERAVRDLQPDVVIHAAGRTPPSEASLLYRANTLATLHLIDALRGSGKPCRFVFAGSAAEYGPVGIEALPVSEDHPSRPAEIYGLSKWLATCATMAANSPVEAVSARVFNPIGPGQPVHQAFGRFAEGLLAYDSSPLSVGDLEIRRDFIDIRDVASALIALGEAGEAGRVYNVGTGESHLVGEGLDSLIRLSGKNVDVRIDPKTNGSVGPRDSRADIRRITEQTGWRPTIAFEQSLNDLWDEALRRSRLPLTA